MSKVSDMKAVNMDVHSINSNLIYSIWNKKWI